MAHQVRNVLRDTYMLQAREGWWREDEFVRDMRRQLTKIRNKSISKTLTQIIVR